MGAQSSPIVAPPNIISDAPIVAAERPVPTRFRLQYAGRCMRFYLAAKKVKSGTKAEMQTSPGAVEHLKFILEISTSAIELI